MRKVGVRVAVGCLVLAAAGVGGFRLVSSSDEDGKAIRIGTTETVTALDPAGAYDGGSWALYSNLYQSLLTFTSGDSEPVPDAASSCGFEGGELLKYVCELRPDLHFSGGRTMTAQDVEFSFRRIIDIGDKQGPKPLLSTLKSVRAEGDRKVVFELRSPDATFPYKIASGAGSIVDREFYPADKLRTDNKVSGSGPYVLKEYKDGEKAVLKPNGEYHGAAGTGRSVTVRYFDSAAALSGAWQRRDIDVVGGGLPPKELADLNPADPELRSMEISAATTRSLVFDLRGHSPMKEKAVRRAIASIIDREQIVRDVYSRTVDPLYSLIPQGMSGHKTPFFDAYPKPDADRARALLQEAGITTPVRFTLGVARGTSSEAETVAVRRQLEDTGLFEVTIDRRDWDGFTNAFPKGEFDAYLISWIADFPDPDTFTTPLVGPEPVFYNGYQSKQINNLILATQREDERSRAVGDFRAIQKIVAEDVPMIPIWQQKDHILSTNDIAGTEYLSDGTGMWRLWKLDHI
ncbi:ABC transporter substrate-binding protein [Streptomyces sp. XD-27]|uniref:ABC transporter substrate-binding protein n=1 Tax=Streptomyces sp. XD-27 TaxID=3062779 RepID=UPI0026F44FBD|nr:ABC transporter substrate-binding protein [Streptomyces sp. XD-27]WKX70835.1 ABC transporter substrate-binding protein [Streptomyces sp. XD-27]